MARKCGKSDEGEVVDGRRGKKRGTGRDAQLLIADMGIPYNTCSSPSQIPCRSVRYLFPTERCGEGKVGL